MFLPNGAEVDMLADQARRYKINRGDTLSAGEIAEIAGEVVGEGAALLQVDKYVENLFNAGIFRDARQRETAEGTKNDRVQRRGVFHDGRPR